jgi:hypothetical protein
MSMLRLLSAIAVGTAALLLAGPASGDPAEPSLGAVGVITCPVNGGTLTYEISPAAGRSIFDTSGTSVLVVQGFTSSFPGFELPLPKGFSADELTTCTGTVTTECCGTVTATIFGIVTPRRKP